MEEDQYRKTYHDINQLRCVFEKVITARLCNCKQAHRFNLADREGVSCQSAPSHLRCHQLLERLRHNAGFALHLKEIDGPLPHAKEIKVQVGGLIGLARLLQAEDATTKAITDIQTLMEDVEDKYRGLDFLPYSEIMKSIAAFQGRRRKK